MFDQMTLPFDCVSVFALVSTAYRFSQIDFMAILLYVHHHNVMMLDVTHESMFAMVSIVVIWVISWNRNRLTHNIEIWDDYIFKYYRWVLAILIYASIS